MTRVIKEAGNVAVPGIGKVAALNVANFAEQARKLVLDARAQAEEILSAARAQARQIESLAAAKTAEAAKRGYEEGRAEGHAKGLAEGQADGAEKAFAEASEKFNRQTEELRTALTATLRKVDAAREDILQQARNDLLELSLAVAEKVTHVYAREHIETAKAAMGQAIELVGCNSQLTVKVCPAQLDQLSEYAGQFLADMQMGQTFKLQAEAALSPGDVVIQGRNGEVDARVQTQIDNVISAITGREKKA
jgi:flagellar assembly protein FliH